MYNGYSDEVINKQQAVTNKQKSIDKKECGLKCILNHGINSTTRQQLVFLASCGLEKQKLIVQLIFLNVM